MIANFKIFLISEIKNLLKIKKDQKKNYNNNLKKKKN